MRLMVIAVLGMLVSTARADPFEIRNPVPDAPPSADITPKETTVEILDPGYVQRRNAVFVTAGGTMLLGASALLSYTMSRRWDAALARLDAGDDPQRAIDSATRAQHTAKWWGTGLFAAGAVAVGVGGYLYFTAPAKVRRERMVVVPAVDRDGVGVSIRGGF
jgi:hypothetical protein